MPEVERLVLNQPLVILRDYHILKRLLRKDCISADCMLERIPLLQGYPMTPINPGPNLLRKRTRKQVLLALFAAVVRSVGCGDGRNAVRSAAVPCIFGNRCFRRSTLCCARRG